MKRNIDDFDGMKDFIISIVGAVAWFLIGTIAIIGYYTIETKGESILISFISMFFTIISSLGIAVTIGVYFRQKKDHEANISSINSKIISHAKTQLKDTFNEFTQKILQIKSISDFINKEYKNSRMYNLQIYDVSIKINYNKYILTFSLKDESEWNESSTDIAIIKKTNPIRNMTFIFNDIENNITQVMKINDTVSSIDIELSEKINLALSEMRTSATFFYNVIHQAGFNDINTLDNACFSLLNNGNDCYTKKKTLDKTPLPGYENVYYFVTTLH